MKPRELEQAQEDLNDVTGKATDKNKELAESYRNLTNGDASVEDLTRIIAALNKEISSESDQNEIARKLEEIVALEAQLQQTENTINRLRLEAEGVDTNRTVVTPLVETGNPIRDLTETRLSPLEGAESDANLRVELDAQANEQLLDARNELNEELAALDEERQQGLRQIAEAGLSAIEDAFGAVFDSQREALELRTQTALDSINAETDARLEAAEGNAALQEQILEEQAAQQRAIEDEAARERKRIAIQEAIIGIALAVIRALPNPFAAIAAGIAGAAQLAIINSQQFKEGGMVDGTGYLDGPSHERGGIPMRVRSSGRQVELEGGEYVVPKKVVQNPAARASLRELENMRKRAGFTTRPLPFQFMEGGIVPNAAFLNRGSESEIMARAVSIAIRSVIPEMAEQVAISTGEAVKDSAPEIARQTGEAVSTGLVESNRENLAEQRRLRDSRI